MHVAIEDVHPFLRPYRFKIILNVLGIPKNSTISFSQDIIEFKAGDATEMNIYSHSRNISGYFPIVIQGIGGDGKVRNATFYLQMYDHNRINPNNESEVWNLYKLSD